MGDRTRLSANFYLHEFTHSETAEKHGITIVVEQGSEVESNIQRLVDTVLQPVRDALGPVKVTSGYRPKKLNLLIGGSRTSQHQYGLAADIVVQGHTPLQVAEWIRDNIDGYDQLIHEFGEWVHVSVAPNTKSPRGNDMTAVKFNGHTHYIRGILPLTEAERVVA